MEQRIKKILENAKLYEEAAFLLNERKQFLPSQVNAALSLELYFKALYLIEKKEDFKIKGKHSHNFYELFNSLSDETKKRMINKFDILMQNRDNYDVEKIENEMRKDNQDIKIPLNLEENLENWSKVFVNGRYYYDYNKELIMMFFPEILQVIKN